MSRRVEIEITSRGSRRVDRGLRGIGGGLDRLRRRARGVTSAFGGMAGAIGGLGVVAGTQQILAFEDRLGALQAKARLTTDEARAMADQVLAVGQAHNLAKEDVTGALEVFQDFGGILRQGSEVLDDIGKRAKATGTPMAQLARVTAALVDSGLTPQQAVQALDQLNAQADAGTVAMADLATVIGEVTKVGATMGQRFQGLAGVKQIGEALQVAGGVFAGDAGQARTAVRALFRDLTAQSGKLKTMGINVFDADGMRDISVLMSEIVQKTGGSAQALSKIFTADSGAIAAAYASAFDPVEKRFKGVVARVAGARGDAATIDEMYRRRMDGVARNSQTVGKALKRLEAQVMDVGGSLLTWVADNFGTATTAVIGAVSAYKLIPPAIAREIAARNTAAGAAAGGLGRVAAAASTVGALLGAAGLGYSLGTLIDQATGASDALADWAWRLANPKEAARRDAARTRQIVESGTIQNRAAALNRAGLDSGAAAKRQDQVVAQAKQQSTPAAPRVLKPGEAAPAGVVTVIVQPAGGVDKVRAEVDRGRSFREDG